MRYGIAAAAVLVIGAAAYYVWRVQRSIERQIRKAVDEAKNAGELPPGIDVERLPPGDLGVPLPKSETRQAEFAQLLVTLRYLLVPLVFILSLVIARLLPRH
jgi:hypothetical protein